MLFFLSFFSFSLSSLYPSFFRAFFPYVLHPLLHCAPTFLLSFFILPHLHFFSFLCPALLSCLSCLSLFVDLVLFFSFFPCSCSFLCPVFLFLTSPLVMYISLHVYFVMKFYLHFDFSVCLETFACTVYSKYAYPNNLSNSVHKVEFIIC